MSMTAKTKLIFNQSLEIYVSDQIRSPLVICSHERSGTHLLMNSLSKCTQYENKPYFDFDFHNLGGKINLFSHDEIDYFFRQIKKIRSENDELCISSLIKSHFPIEFLGDKVLNSIKIIYIYRNPVDLFTSYWKYLNSISYFLGPKTSTPLETAQHIPCGFSQRYQPQNYKNYFERWAMHVSNAFSLKDKYQNIQLISFNDIKNNHNMAVEKVCSDLEIRLINQPSLPLKSDYFIGSDLNILSSQKEALKDYCYSEILKYSHLPKEVMNA